MALWLGCSTTLQNFNLDSGALAVCGTIIRPKDGLAIPNRVGAVVSECNQGETDLKAQALQWKHRLEEGLNAEQSIAFDMWLEEQSGAREALASLYSDDTVPVNIVSGEARRKLSATSHTPIVWMLGIVLLAGLAMLFFLGSARP